MIDEVSGERGYWVYGLIQRSPIVSAVKHFRAATLHGGQAQGPPLRVNRTQVRSDAVCIWEFLNSQCGGVSVSDFMRKGSVEKSSWAGTGACPYG